MARTAHQTKPPASAAAPPYTVEMTRRSSPPRVAAAAAICSRHRGQTVLPDVSKYSPVSGCWQLAHASGPALAWVGSALSNFRAPSFAPTGMGSVVSGMVHRTASGIGGRRITAYDRDLRRTRLPLA